MYRFFDIAVNIYNSFSFSSVVVPFHSKTRYSTISVFITFTLSLLLILSPLASYAQSGGDGPSGQIEGGPGGAVQPDGVPPEQQSQVDSGGPVHPPFELPDDYVGGQSEDGVSGASGASSSDVTETAKLSENTVHPLIDNLDGSLTYAYPLTVPEGRNGLTPQHNLVFRSSNKKSDNIFGYGWEIDIPYIERSTKKGSDKIYTASDYISSLDGEMVKQNTTTISSTPYSVKEYSIGNEQKIVPTDWRANTGFGHIASISGDYLAMGAPRHDLDDDSTNAVDGVVYVYKRQTSGSWNFLQQLSDTANPGFGSNVSLSGDYLAISSSSGPKIFVYKRGTNDVWGNRQEVALTTTNAVDAIYLDGDTLAIKTEDSNYREHIIIYKRNVQDSWIKKQSLYPSGDYNNRYNNKEFGDRISLSGDYLAVSSPGGVVFIYKEGQNGEWGIASKNNDPTKYENQLITIPEPLRNDTRNAKRDTFGSSIALNGNTLVIGMSGESTGIQNSGTVYIYTRQPNGTWGNPVKLKASNTHSNIVFGSWGIFLDGSTLTVGAKDTKRNEYMFYVYKKGDDGVWGFERKVTPSGNTNNFSGRSLSLEGGHIAIGFTEHSGQDRGKEGIYTYTISETTTKNTTQSEAYKPRVEKGAFREYEKIGDYWVVTDTVGTKYYFGETLQARQDGTVQWETETFRWMLERVEDANGNTIQYTYTKDHGQIYPEKIAYVNTSGGSYAYSLQFTKQERGDQTKFFNKGFPVTTRYVINGIDFYKGAEKLFSYKQDLDLITELKYAYVIKALYKYGKDAGGNWTTGPKTKFTYNNTISYTKSSYESYNPENNLIDATRDGMPDIVALGSTNDTKVNNGNSFNSAIDVFPSFNDVQGMFDMNGDYYPDFRITSKSCRRCSTNSYVYRNNGSSNRFSRTSINRDFHTAYIADGLGDVNGDGTLDVFPKKYNQHVSGGGWDNYNVVHVFLNTDGFTLTESSDIVVPYELYSRRGSVYYRILTNTMLDYNGDGLADASNTVLNNGFGWSADGDYLNHPSIYFSEGGANFNTDKYTTGSYAWIDINSDGMHDRIVSDIYNNDSLSNENVAQTRDYGYRVYLNKGIGGYQYSKKYTDALRDADLLEYANGGSDGNIYIQSTIDINGDGINDIISKKPKVGSRSRGYDYYYYIADGILELNKITTESGGNFEVSYTAAATHDTTNKVPFPLRIVSSVTYKDTHATDNTETFTYTGGHYYFNSPSDKKFTGFETVERTHGNRKEKIYYHQGNGSNTTNAEPTDSYAKIGLPYKKEVYQAAANDGESDILLEKTEYTYNETSNGTNSKYVYLTKEKKTVYDSSSATFGDDYSNSIEYTYDTYGNVLTETKKSGSTVLRKIAYTYITPDTVKYIVSLPSKETVKNASDVVIAETEYTYDSKGNMLTEEKKIDGTTKQKRTYTYNTRGQMLTENDSLDNTTTYTYDTNSLRITQETNPLSHVTQYEYDETSGAVTKRTDPNSFEIYYEFDGIDRLTAIKKKRASAKETAVDYSYNYATRPYSVQRREYLGSATRTQKTYIDGLGRIIQTKTSNGAKFDTEDITYTERGLVEKKYTPYQSSSSTYTTTPTGTTKTSYTYDGLNRMTSAVSPVGTVASSYDGHTVEITSAEGKKKRLEHDSYGRLHKVHEIDGASTYTTTYTYDPLDRITKVKDALNNVRSIQYDMIGRTTSIEDLHHTSDTTYKTLQFTYNKEYLTSKTKRDGTAISYTYDTLGRVLTEDRTSVTGTDYTYTYDSCENGKGSVCTVTSADSVNATYKYDKEGNLKEEAKTISGTAYTTTYTHNLQNGVVTTTLPNSVVIKNIYGKNGQISSVSVDDTPFTTLTYNAFGLVDTKTGSNGSEETNTYDSSGRLTIREIKRNNIAVARKLEYTYDRDNNITAIVDTDSSGVAANKAYTYDNLNRLTGATVTNNGSNNYTRSYTYNAIGNITSKTGTGNYTYLTSGDATFTTPHMPTMVGTAAQTYDTNGNLLTDGTNTLTWDYKDRVKTITERSDTYTYLYDHEGNRVKETKGTDTIVYVNPYHTIENNVVENHVFAGGEVVGSVKNVSGVSDLCKLTQSSLLFTLTPNTGYTKTTENGNILVKRGTETAATIAPNTADARCKKTQQTHLYADALGSTIAGIDKDGTLTQAIDYYPYGGEHTETGTTESLYTHTGNITDETDFIYRNARYYDPEKGQFISQDPVVEYIGSPREFEASTGTPFTFYLTNPQAQHTYSYALNNPMKFEDPDGEFAITAGTIIGIATFLSVSYSGYKYIKDVLKNNELYTGVLSGSVEYKEFYNHNRGLQMNTFFFAAGSLVATKVNTLRLLVESVFFNEILDRAISKHDFYSLEAKKKGCNKISGNTCNQSPNAPKITVEGNSNTASNVYSRNNVRSMQGKTSNTSANLSNILRDISRTLDKLERVLRNTKNKT